MHSALPTPMASGDPGHLPPRIVQEPVVHQTAPDLSILQESLTSHNSTKKSVFGSVHGWNDPPMKPKDSTVDCSEFRRKKRKNFNSGDLPVSNFVPGPVNPVGPGPLSGLEPSSLPPMGIQLQPGMSAQEAQ